MREEKPEEKLEKPWKKREIRVWQKKVSSVDTSHGNTDECKRGKKMKVKG